MRILLILAALFLAATQGWCMQKPERESSKTELCVDCQASPFGVLDFIHWNEQWNNYQYPDDQSIERSLDLMKQAGVCWLRMDFLWGDIEPAEGQFEFAKYDRLVGLVLAKGIRILGILGYSADWAAEEGAWNSPPRQNSLFAKYAAEVASHYKGRISHWEIWNEPDSPTYWEKQDGLVGYCSMLKEAYKAIKEADPACQVLNGGMANPLLSTNRLYDNGAGDSFDILNLHIFATPIYPKSVKSLLSYVKLAAKIMARHGQEAKKIWVTEIGCPGVKRNLKVPQWWMGMNPTEKQQAQWVSDVYTQLLSHPSVEKVFWAFFRDTNKHWNSGTDYFGLVRNNFSTKPSYKAYKETARKWYQKK